jgi:hypothetical protein
MEDKPVELEVKYRYKGPTNQTYTTDTNRETEDKKAHQTNTKTKAVGRSHGSQQN